MTRRPWTAAECTALRSRYPHENTVVIARDLQRNVRTVYAKAAKMGLSKTPERLVPHNRDPAFYVLGALRVNADGYIDMRISFEHGSRGWRGLHRILWEDAHGPVPAGYSVCFKNGDPLDCELANLELISRRDLMLRNSVHNYPRPIAQAIMLRGAVVRAIKRKSQ